jgi:hypothetical protein
MNNIENIIDALKQQRERLNAAIGLLEQTNVHHDRFGSARRRGQKRHYRMSAAARRRISANLKTRWADAKKAGRNSL